MNHGAGKLDARLLVVDDERINRDNSCAYSAGMTTRCCGARKRSAMLELAESSEIDLVLLDVVMPELDGFACLQELRTTRCVTELPVIMDPPRPIGTSRSARSNRAPTISSPSRSIPTFSFAASVRIACGKPKQTFVKVKNDMPFRLACGFANDGLRDWEIAFDLTIPLAPISRNAWL